MAKANFDQWARAAIEHTCEVVRARIVTDLPQYAGSAELAKAIERAATEFAAVGQRDLRRLIQYADFQARAYLFREAVADYNHEKVEQTQAGTCSEQRKSPPNVDPYG